MPNETNANLGNPERASGNDEFRTSVTGKDSKLDRTAERAAQKASKTEKNYDQENNIFTK
jgi:hypothetical protein